MEPIKGGPLGTPTQREAIRGGLPARGFQKQRWDLDEVRLEHLPGCRSQEICPCAVVIKGP
ncbi:Hypothetical protein SMAX5B_014528 [Scophthalmus maximus]|uniref:Uncharacterized protein n=1 Tax=Scophthalmus maximus TaxID=52904 RepID=A0A2U9C0L9_SCOMX|nr:Hypothetical protein SMAX5B_014528 [Scophthalmus maximus]